MKFATQEEEEAGGNMGAITRERKKKEKEETYLLTGGGHSGRSAIVTSARHKHGLHAFLECALFAVDDVAHEDVDQGVLHQREKDEDGAAGHEHVNSLLVSVYHHTQRHTQKKR